jgi:hypothetical protein
MSFPRRRHLGLALLVLGSLVPLRAALAESPELLPRALAVTEMFSAEQRSGLALEGYDPITYRLGSAPQLGKGDYEYVWRGLVWRFVSEANRAAFSRNPDIYAPRIGGYDAERITRDVLVAADPEIYVVRADALYLFRNSEHRRRFLADQGLAAQAEGSWTRTKTRLVQG